MSWLWATEKQPNHDLDWLKSSYIYRKVDVHVMLVYNYCVALLICDEVGFVPAMKRTEQELAGGLVVQTKVSYGYMLDNIKPNPHWEAESHPAATKSKNTVTR